MPKAFTCSIRVVPYIAGKDALMRIAQHKTVDQFIGTGSSSQPPRLPVPQKALPQSGRYICRADRLRFQKFHLRCLDHRIRRRNPRGYRLKLYHSNRFTHTFATCLSDYLLVASSATRQIVFSLTSVTRPENGA